MGRGFLQWGWGVEKRAAMCLCYGAEYWEESWGVAVQILGVGS